MVMFVQRKKFNGKIHIIKVGIDGIIGKKRKTAKQKGQVYKQQVLVMAAVEGRC